MFDSEKLVCPVTGLWCEFAGYCGEQKARVEAGQVPDDEVIGAVVSQLPEQRADAVAGEYCSSRTLSALSQVAMDVRLPVAAGFAADRALVVVASARTL